MATPCIYLRLKVNPYKFAAACKAGADPKEALGRTGIKLSPNAYNLAILVDSRCFIMYDYHGKLAEGWIRLKCCCEGSKYAVDLNLATGYWKETERSVPCLRCMKNYTRRFCELSALGDVIDSSADWCKEFRRVMEEKLRKRRANQPPKSASRAKNAAPSFKQPRRGRPRKLAVDDSPPSPLDDSAAQQTPAKKMGTKAVEAFLFSAERHATLVRSPRQRKRRPVIMSSAEASPAQVQQPAFDLGEGGSPESIVGGDEEKVEDPAVGAAENEEDDLEIPEDDPVATPPLAAGNIAQQLLDADVSVDAPELAAAGNEDEEIEERVIAEDGPPDGNISQQPSLGAVESPELAATDDEDEDAEELEFAEGGPARTPPPDINDSQLQLFDTDVSMASDLSSVASPDRRQATPVSAGLPPPVNILASDSSDVATATSSRDVTPDLSGVIETPRSAVQLAARRLSFVKMSVEPLDLEPTESPEDEEELPQLENMASLNGTENLVDTSATGGTQDSGAVDNAGIGKSVDVSAKDKADYEAWLERFFFPMQKKLNEDFGGFLFGRLAEQQKDFDERMRVKNGEVQDLNDELTEVKGDLMKTEGALLTKTTAFENLEQDKNDISGKLQDANVTIIQKDEELEALGQAKSAVDLELSQTKGVVVAKETEISGLKTRVTGLNSTISEHTQKIAGLTKQRDRFMRESKKQENKYNVTSGKFVDTVDYAKRLRKILNREDIKSIMEANAIEMPDDPNVIVLSPSPEALVGSVASTSSVGLDNVFPEEDVKKNLDGEY